MVSRFEARTLGVKTSHDEKDLKFIMIACLPNLVVVDLRHTRSRRWEQLAYRLDDPEECEGIGLSRPSAQSRLRLV